MSAGQIYADIDALRAIKAASRNSDFQGYGIGITDLEMSPRLETEADFTLNGVNDVKRFPKWMYHIMLPLS